MNKLVFFICKSCGFKFYSDRVYEYCVDCERSK